MQAKHSVKKLSSKFTMSGVFLIFTCESITVAMATYIINRAFHTKKLLK